METAVKRRCASSCPLTEKSTKRRKRTYFNDHQLNRLEQVFEEDMFPDFDRRETLARELGIGEDRIHVWFQNRRSRWRKREIKNKPAPVTSSAQSCRQLKSWVPEQCSPTNHPSNFGLPTCGTAYVPTYNNFWGVNIHGSSSCYFPQEFPAVSTVGTSAFMDPSFRFIYPPTSSPSSPPVMTAEEKTWSGQNLQNSTQSLSYDSDSTENSHSSDEYLAAMGLLSVFSREN